VLSCSAKIKVFVKNYTTQKAAQIQYLCAMSQFAHDKVVPYSQSNA
jgi:hypothetical protein